MARIIPLFFFLMIYSFAADAEEHCRRVQLIGTVKYAPIPKTGFRGTANGPEGKFKIELLFPENGGEPISQKNFIELVDIKSYSFGGAKSCTVTLPQRAREPRAFTIWAELTPDQVVATYGSDPHEHVSDQLDFRIRQLPPLAPIAFSTHCEGGRPAESSDHGVSYNQLLLPFATRRFVHSITLNKIGVKSSPLVLEMPGANQATVEWEEMETLMPCAGFQ